MVSRYYAEFVREVIGAPEEADNCVGMIEAAFSLSTHLVRVRSVARTAGFCSYYGRMVEKMGVYEVLESSSVTRGREVHRILGLASLNLFLEHPTPRPEQAESLAKGYVADAVEELKDLVDVREDAVEVAVKLLERLISALPKAKWLLGLNLDEPLFPLAEQTFADYDTRIYGAPDLILESEEKRKALVIEWKTYRPGEGYRYPDEFEMAQVVAYSILEAKRLGIARKNIFESISGIEARVAKRLSEPKNSQSFVIDANTVRSAGLLRVLPVIVTPSGGYPPHPFMYKGVGDTRKRFAKLYRIFRGVIVAAEYLALQVMNIPELLSVGGYLNATAAIRRCTTKEGYQISSYTPFKYLRSGKPGEWKSHPCARCPFKGDDGPCAFYFGSRKPKDYFDKLMWWARFKVYWERERDLVSHRAMHELFRNNSIGPQIFSSGNPIEISVDFSKIPRLRVNVEGIKGGPAAYLVRVKRGSQDLGKFRFDYFKVSDVEFDKENNIIELKRDLRDVEKRNNIVGFLKKSIHLSIVEPNKTVNPLLSISTFVMIDESFLSDDGRVIYRCYSPSPTLLQSFTIFGKYIEEYKRKGSEAIVLAYETPVDLTIMELRAIDALHRYLKQVPRESGHLISYLEQHGVIGIKEEDLLKEAETLKKRVPHDESVTAVLHLRELLSKRIVVVGNGKEDSLR